MAKSVHWPFFLSLSFWGLFRFLFLSSSHVKATPNWNLSFALTRQSSSSSSSKKWIKYSFPSNKKERKAKVEMGLVLFSSIYTNSNQLNCNWFCRQQSWLIATATLVLASNAVNPTQILLDSAIEQEMVRKSIFFLFLSFFCQLFYLLEPFSTWQANK